VKKSKRFEEIILKRKGSQELQEFSVLELGS
jgi:hypothetical protein